VAKAVSLGADEQAVREVLASSRSSKYSYAYARVRTGGVAGTVTLAPCWLRLATCWLLAGATHGGLRRQLPCCRG
jgi:hypothetical protein